MPRITNNYNTNNNFYNDPNSSSKYIFPNLVIIGDTSEASSYAYRVIKHIKCLKTNVPKVHLIYQANDMISCHPRIFRTDWPLTNVLDYDNYINTQRVMHRAKGLQPCSSDPPFGPVSFLQHWQIGRSPCGNLLILPNLLEAGPCNVEVSTERNSLKFLKQNTVKYPYNSVEINVVRNLAAATGMNLVDKDDKILSGTGILKSNHVYFAKCTKNGILSNRNLIQKSYFKLLKRYSNLITIYYNAQNIRFEQNVDGIFYNVYFDLITTTKKFSITPVEILDASVKFKTDPITWCRLVTLGKYYDQSPTIRIPIQYRAVLPIPISAITDNEGNVMAPKPDLITTSAAFSCSGLSQNTGNTFAYCSNMSFVGTFYTIDEDLRTGLFAPNKKFTLIVIEAVMTNQPGRNSYYDQNFLAQAIDFNSAKTEAKDMFSFKQLINYILQAYGVSPIPIIDDPAITPNSNDLVNAAGNIAHEAQLITSTPPFYMKPTVLLGLINAMYIQNIMQPQDN